MAFARVVTRTLASLWCCLQLLSRVHLRRLTRRRRPRPRPPSPAPRPRWPIRSRWRRPRRRVMCRRCPLRDKLAQLLMVGVRDAADARAVVDRQSRRRHLHRQLDGPSMLTDGSLADIAGAAGPLALAVSVDEEGGRVQRLSSLIGSQPVAAGAGADQDARRGVPDRVRSAARQMRGPRHHRGLRARRRRHLGGGRHRDRRPVVRLGSCGGHRIRRRLRARTA